MKKILLPAALLLLPMFGVWAQYDPVDFKELHILAGTWSAERKAGKMYEQWTIINDSTMSASSYSVKDSNTTITETIVLSYRNGIVRYTPTTMNQNNQQPVEFTLVKIDNGRFDFENKAHDFPNLISYEVRHGDSLYASISGNTANGRRTIPFNFVREK